MGMFSKSEKDGSGGSRGSDSSPPPAFTTDDNYDISDGLMQDNADQLQRHLGNRQIQLIAIGGSIGTALFVSIGGGLYRGGPGNLLLAYASQSIVLAMVNNGIAEITTAYPVSGGFIRHAGEFVDDALGFMVGWNFFFYEALLIPFEISAFATVLGYWSEKTQETGPLAGIIIGVIICYAAINALAVGIFGEAEFWLSGGKVVLIFILFLFTFITMVGGNPRGDAYGFRYWQGGAAFKEYLSTGSLGRFEGYMGSMSSAAFTVVGPEYISIVAAEAMRPRHYIKNAFKTVYVRFGIFFIGGALAVGIACNSMWRELYEVVVEGKGTGAAASPYVLAMTQLGIGVLPDIVNALILTSIFSAGNTYTYCAIRNLYSLSLEGRAPKVLQKCTKSGVPIYCFAITMIFPVLAFTAVSSGSAVAITWFASLVTGGGLINYVVMSITYIRFHGACRVQGLDRGKLPYTGYFQPWCAYFALVWMTLVLGSYGYTSFTPWNTSNFFSNYTMQIFIPPLYIIWKLIHKTKVIPLGEVDLVWEKPIIDAYEETFLEPAVGFWSEMLQLVGIGRKKHRNANRRSSMHASDVAQARREMGQEMFGEK